MVQLNLDALHARDISPAVAALMVARANGIDNVDTADWYNLEWVGESCVIAVSVDWLDTCGDEENALALLSAQICEKADMLDTDLYVSNTICAMEYDMHRFEEFARLFVY